MYKFIGIVLALLALTGNCVAFDQQYKNGYMMGYDVGYDIARERGALDADLVVINALDNPAVNTFVRIFVDALVLDYNKRVAEYNDFVKWTNDVNEDRLGQDAYYCYIESPRQPYSREGGD